MKTNLQPLHHYINKACSSIKSILLLLVLTSICFTANAVVPTITSATYDAATGALVVTGTNLVAKPPSKPSPNPNDIVVSKLTLTGDGGATRTLTSTFVEISLVHDKNINNLIINIIC